MVNGVGSLWFLLLDFRCFSMFVLCDFTFELFCFVDC